MKKITMNAIIKTGLNDNGDMIIYLLTLYGATKKELITFLKLPQRDAVTFCNYTQLVEYIKKKVKIHGFYIDKLSSDFNGVIYDVNFIDISNEMPRVDRFFVSCLI